MDCEICLESFDHSVHKPYSLSCPHTFCFTCIQKLADNRCPLCKSTIQSKNINIALLKFIPESRYDKLKTEALKAFIQMNEIKQDLKISRQEKLKYHIEKLESTKQEISDETARLITVLKQNEETLKTKCNLLIDYVNVSLDSNDYEENDSFQIIDISQEQIEINQLDENELTCLNNRISEMKLNLTRISDQIKHFECNYEFIPNENIFSIGEIKQYSTNEESSEDMLSNSNVSSYCCLRGHILFNLLKYEESIKFYNKAVLLNPNNSKCYFSKSAVLVKLKKYQESIQCIDKAIEIDPNESDYYYTKALTLASLEKYDEAIQNYDAAIRINPNESKYYSQKVIALSCLKRYEEAFLCYCQNAFEIKTNN